MAKKQKEILNNNQSIVLKGVRVHNLKNVNLVLPKFKLIVFTGVSGSGKSSLVFDTIYAEGQRRYVESLSSYARQFLEKMNKPDLDYVSGLAPSMAIEQKTSSQNSRSTVGTITEIYDYLRLLFARIGITYSPISNSIVKKDTPASIIKQYQNKNSYKLYILSLISTDKYGSISGLIKALKEKGYYKVYIGDELYDLTETKDDEIEKLIKKSSYQKISILIDRFTFHPDDGESISRFTEAIETAFREGEGYLTVRQIEEDKKTDINYNYYFESDGIKFEEPEPKLFSFNNPYGACRKCQGFGRTMDIDMDLVIQDKNKSITNGAILPFTTPKHSRHLTDLILEADRHGIDINIPFRALSREQRDYVYNGGGRYIGIKKFFKMVEREASYKLHYRVLLNRYRSYTTCSECGGSRLRKEALYVKIKDKNIADIVCMKISEANEFFSKIKLDDYHRQIAGRVLEEITSRLKYLLDVGLEYLTLDRLTNSLSGGEAQRINLSTSLGSSLVGSIYVLDEPSIGLHPRDNDKLINIMKSLRDIGNTVLVVEHDKDMIREADYIVDVGLYAGENGGEIIYTGDYQKLKKQSQSLTGKYLSGQLKVKLENKNRKINSSTEFLTIYGARENNLKNIDVKIPLKMFTCITGVSGSGKSTLVNSILYNGIYKQIYGSYEDRIGEHDRIDGIDKLEDVEMIDQSPIGKTTRSNPITYIKAFDEIRELFASTTLSKRKGFDNGTFSFNVPGGRCEACEGAGVIKVEMQFMADIILECESCLGKRYKADTLEVRVTGNNNEQKNIDDVLNLNVSEAIKFFRPYPRILKKLKILDEVGLGYLKLGQSGSTLSGGESQRLKLAYHLANQIKATNTLFIFDEPTTGLHYYDISKLIKSFEELLRRGNTIVVIEHNPELIKLADHIIDLGPESGDRGGYIIAEGTPEIIAKNKNSYTGKYLKNIL